MQTFEWMDFFMGEWREKVNLKPVELQDIPY